MRRWFKRLVIALILLVVLLIGGGWWFLSYIAPQETLDLSYEHIDVKEKAISMVKRMKPELILTEADINNLIKMQLQDGAANAKLPPGVALDGARFELNGDLLLAHLNVTYKERIPAAVLVTYRMTWENPNVIITPLSMDMKGIALPQDTLEPFIISLDLTVQDLVSVGDVRFEEDRMIIKLQVNL